MDSILRREILRQKHKSSESMPSSVGVCSQGNLYKATVTPNTFHLSLCGEDRDLTASWLPASGDETHLPAHHPSQFSKARLPIRTKRI